MNRKSKSVASAITLFKSLRLLFVGSTEIRSICEQSTLRRKVQEALMYVCMSRSIYSRCEACLEAECCRHLFRPKRDQVTGDWKEVHNEEFHNLHSSPNIVRMIKLRRMRWAGNVA
jgi:hypothetical protein